MRGAELALDVRGDRAVLTGANGREADPQAMALGDELTDALHEWARVSAVVNASSGRTPDRETGDVEDPGGGEGPGGSGGGAGVDGAAVVARRGRQLAGRVAETLGVAVSFHDPVEGRTFVLTPPAGHGHPEDDSHAAETGPAWDQPHHAPPRRHAGPAYWRARAAREPGPTPWGTGLLAAGFFAAVMIVAMLALAGALASATHGLVAVAACLVVTAGLAPSLWLGRHVPVVRWIVGGTAAGIALSWIGVLVIAL